MRAPRPGGCPRSWAQDSGGAVRTNTPHCARLEQPVGFGSLQGHPAIGGRLRPSGVRRRAKLTQDRRGRAREGTGRCHLFTQGADTGSPACGPRTLHTHGLNPLCCGHTIVSSFRKRNFKTERSGFHSGWGRGCQPLFSCAPTQLWSPSCWLEHSVPSSSFLPPSLPSPPRALTSDRHAGNPRSHLQGAGAQWKGSQGAWGCGCALQGEHSSRRGVATQPRPPHPRPSGTPCARRAQGRLWVGPRPLGCQDTLARHNDKNIPRTHGSFV